MGLQGLSLLEMQISMLLLMLVTLYLMSLFASGQRHARRALDFSKATIIANNRLEEARATPVSDIQPGIRLESDPYQGFNTTLTLEPFEGSLWQVGVETRAPSGALAKHYTLLSDASKFHGVVADAFAHNILWVQGSQLMAWDEVAGRARNLGSVSDGRLGGGLSGQPGSNLVWRGGPSQAPLAFWENFPAPATWGPPLLNPTQSFPALAPGNFSGLAGDAFGSQLLLADQSNQGLWLWTSAGWSNLLQPSQPKLGRPSGLVCDPHLSLAWVADQDFQCLRKLLLSSAAAANYPAAELESAGPVGTWHRQRFRPPAQFGMGSPMGLAMDPWGWAVYLHDRSRLYRWIDSNQSWEVLGDLPSALLQERPSGLASDRFGNQLYLATEVGGLWKVRAQTHLRASDFRKLWP